MIQISDQFSAGRMIRFTLPTILTMIFGSIYGIVDGIFISNCVGKTAFAAVNFIMPVLMILGTVGLMFGTGGSALCAKMLGEQNRKGARAVFSLLTYALIGLGLILAGLGWLFMPQILQVLGAREALASLGTLYGRLSMIGLPFFILQYYFQALLITEGRPGLNFGVTFAAGIANIVLDYLFVAVFAWGIPGAAFATIIGQCIGAIVPLAVFALTDRGSLHLGKPELSLRPILQTCLNGSSELMTNVCQSLISILFNWQLLRFAGEDGVAAYGVLMYVSMIFSAFFFGYSMGIAPVISYNYGADNRRQLRFLYRTSLVIVAILSIAMFGAAELSAPFLAGIFTGYDRQLYVLTLEGFHLFSWSFLFSGIPIFGSSFFTALNNGPVSALISFVRSLIFQTAFILILPELWQITGIWLSVPFAEGAAMTMTFLLLHAKKKRYGY